VSYHFRNVRRSDQNAIQEPIHGIVVCLRVVCCLHLTKNKGETVSKRKLARTAERWKGLVAQVGACRLQITKVVYELESDSDMLKEGTDGSSEEHANLCNNRLRSIVLRFTSCNVQDAFVFLSECLHSHAF
jgi:hypothetical protein